MVMERGRLSVDRSRGKARPGGNAMRARTTRTYMNGVTVLHRDELEAADGTSDVSREVAFETEDTVMVRSRVAGGVTTGWHHNGDRHVYGYVTRGHAVLEYGTDGEDSVALDAGDFVYVPPRTVRRVANPTDEDWTIVICFVGAGPPAVAVDGPQAGTE